MGSVHIFAPPCIVSLIMLSWYFPTGCNAVYVQYSWDLGLVSNTGKCRGVYVQM